jgi:hypothetical protein
MVKASACCGAGNPVPDAYRCPLNYERSFVAWLARYLAWIMNIALRRQPDYAIIVFATKGPHWADRGQLAQLGQKARGYSGLKPQDECPYDGFVPFV